jgi:hypothetical protein
VTAIPRVQVWIVEYANPAWNAVLAGLSLVLTWQLRRIVLELPHEPREVGSSDASSRAPRAWAVVAMPAIAIFLWAVQSVDTSDSVRGFLVPTAAEFRRAFITFLLCFAWTVPWALSPEKPLWRWLLYGGLATLAVTLATLAFAA